MMVMPTNPLARALNLPRTRLFKLLGLLAALLAFALAVLAASGGMLQNLYSSWQLARSNTILLYLPADTPPAALQPLTTTLPTLAGVKATRLVPPAELLATLSPALGTLSGTIPLPQVAEVELTPLADRNTLLTTLQQTFPLAEIDDQQALLADVATSVRTLQLAAGAGALLLGFILALFMTLTVRAGLLTQRSVVQLLIQLGATDGTLARTLTLQAVQPVALGTALGTTLAAAALGLAAALHTGVAAHLGLASWVLALALPFTMPLLAGLTAYMVALRLLNGTESAA